MYGQQIAAFEPFNGQIVDKIPFTEVKVNSTDFFTSASTPFLSQRLLFIRSKLCQKFSLLKHLCSKAVVACNWTETHIALFNCKLENSFETYQIYTH